MRFANELSEATIIDRVVTVGSAGSTRAVIPPIPPAPAPAPQPEPAPPQEPPVGEPGEPQVSAWAMRRVARSTHL